MNLNRFIKKRLGYKGCSQTIYANFSTINIKFFKHYTDNIFFFRIMETHIASYMKSQKTFVYLLSVVGFFKITLA